VARKQRGMKVIQENALLTRKELARQLSVDPNTVEKLAAAGRIPAPIDLGVGGKKMLRWRRSDWERWLTTGVVEPAASNGGAT
jgi:excisionase family DNA binding protein